MLVDVPRLLGQQPEEGHTLESHRGPTAPAFTSPLPWEKTLKSSKEEKEGGDRGGWREKKEEKEEGEEEGEGSTCAPDFVFLEVTVLCLFFHFRFDGRVVAKLPFTPLSYIQGLSHRNLLGDDTTDCSFIFLYILCTMSIRQVSIHTP